MATTGDEGSDTDSVPDEVFRRSSSTAPDTEAVQSTQTHNELIPPREDASNASPGPSPGRGEQSGEDEYDEDEDDDRPNHYPGPDSTWRWYTEPERGLAASLDQERANDLSIHLYNAHALKARVRDPEVSSSSAHHQSKKRWIKANEDGTLPWDPEPSWTAWPLEPEDVPRRDEGFGVDVLSVGGEASTYRKQESWKPSGDLAEEIQAIMLREVKERLRNRPPPQPAAGIGAPHRYVKSASPRKRRRSSSSDSNTDSSTSAESGSGRHTQLPGGNVSSMQDGDGEPSILTDDDLAAENLGPSVQNVWNKLDGLLLGLHRSRQGHHEHGQPKSRSQSKSRKARSGSKTAKETKTATTSSNEDVKGVNGASVSGAQQESSTEVVPRKGKAKSKTRTADLLQENVPASAKDTTSNGDATTSRMPKRKAPLNPRDWSEVLAAASFAGWDSVVVKRAAGRCSSLFGESMVFAESSAGPIDRDASASTDFVIKDDAKQRLSCPIAECPRHNDPFEKAWRWREHMKRSHRYGKDEIEELETISKAQLASDDFQQRQCVCQVEGCTRMGVPFDKPWRWREHMKRRHGCETNELERLEREFSGAVEVPPDEQDGVIGAKMHRSEAEEAADRTEDATPADGFLRPIKLEAKRSKGSRNKATKRDQHGGGPGE